MMVEENISLRPYNSFGIEAKARYFSTFDSLEALEELLEHPVARHQNLLVLGGGSNILLTQDVNALVLRNNIPGKELIGEDDRYFYIKAGAGENWHRFVMYCVENNYAGIENLSLIPGSVGASPMQNIGAYGVEIKDVFQELEAYHIADKKLQRFSLSDCAFGYRESVFKNKVKGEYIITSVTYRLSKEPKFNTSYGAIQQELERMGVSGVNIKALSQAVINIRSSKLPDPAVTGNAGSFFKNPLIPISQFESLKERFPGVVSFPAANIMMKLAAGWLIEQCGWKGYRKGDAGCYPKQALVLVNYGKATGREIWELSEAIIKSVQDRFGVTLEREVNII